MAALKESRSVICTTCTGRQFHCTTARGKKEYPKVELIFVSQIKLKNLLEINSFLFDFLRDI